MTIWTYVFEDGTKLELLNVGLSGQELIALADIHGKVTVSCRQE